MRSGLPETPATTTPATGTASSSAAVGAAAEHGQQRQQVEGGAPPRRKRYGAAEPRPARHHSTSFGRMSLIEPRSTTSPISSISVGSALRMTMRAPLRLARGTTPAIG